MRHHRIIPKLLAGLFIALIMGGALFLFTSPDKEKPYVIYIPKIVDNSNEFWATLLAGANMAAREYNANLSVMAADSETNFQQQNEIIEKAIRMKPDVIAISPNSFEENTETLKKVKESGIPLVYIDSITDDPLADTVVATDNVEMGTQLGACIKNKLPKDAHIVIMGHVKNSSTALEREKGIRIGLGSDEALIEEVLFCESSFQKAYTMTKELMERKPETNVLVGLNEYASTGVAQAIKDLGLKDQVKVYGTDSSTEQIRKLEEGINQAIVIQNPFNMGYLGIMQAIQLAQGKEIQKNIPVESQLITKSNMYSVEKQKLLFPFIGKQATQDIVFE